MKLTWKCDKGHQFEVPRPWAVQLEAESGPDGLARA